MTRIFDTALLDVLGWAVVHSLWQGALILGLVYGARRLAGPGRPQLAYLAGVGGLALSLLAFLATAFILAGGIAETPSAGPALVNLPGGTAPVAQAGGGAAVAPSTEIEWRSAMPWLGALWALGFLVLAFQCMYAWAKTRCYATIGLSAPSTEWTDRFAVLTERSGIRLTTRLRVSALVESPVTLGTLRPLVLVPAGFLTGFPPSQVEAILMHELAHIRRNDFLVGLIQTAIRTVLYFNPAVRVMSRWVDEDREQACDDFAVARTGRPLDLAKGLAALRLSLAPQPLMAANDAKGGPLLARLERLAGQASSARGLDRFGAAAIAAALLAVTLWGSSSYAHPPKAEEVRRILILQGEMPELPEMPEMPDMPPAPPPPALPALPEMGFDPLDPRSTREFEARMEAWGESMEEWGEEYGERMEETFGEEFETRMEAWGEKMEAWGETVEAQGEALEALDDMSDDELAERGLTRRDVEVATEAWGLEIAGGVMDGILPGFIAGEAHDEIDAQKAELDQDAIDRVREALKSEELAGGPRWLEKRYTDPAQKARDKARAARDAAHAKRDAERAKRDAERAKRDARRAQRDAERSLRDAQRAEADAIDANAMSAELVARLREDGLVGRSDERIKFWSTPDKTYVDGERQPDRVHARYRDWLRDRKVAATAKFELKVQPSGYEFKLTDGDSRTHVTMTR